MLSSSMVTSTMSSLALADPTVARMRQSYVLSSMTSIKEATQEQGEQGGGQADAGSSQGFAHEPRG